MMRKSPFLCFGITYWVSWWAMSSRSELNV